MSIPLCRSYVEDKLVWPFTPSGTYTVKLGYRFLVNENSINSAPMNSNQNDGVWKLIWALSVPNKVKNFVWRSCRDALLIKYNLRRCQILMDDACDHCQSSIETVLHAVWDCPKISRVWDTYQELNFHRRLRFTAL